MGSVNNTVVAGSALLVDYRSLSNEIYKETQASEEACVV
jgi:hypothetical protein